VVERGYEGYIAKDEASPYVGGVTKSWLKVKVPGWTDPDDRSLEAHAAGLEWSRSDGQSPTRTHYSRPGAMLRRPTTGALGGPRCLEGAAVVGGVLRFLHEFIGPLSTSSLATWSIVPVRP
jgi:hypothetical protein